MRLCASGKLRIKIGDWESAESLGLILNWRESIIIQDAKSCVVSGTEQSTTPTPAQILAQLGCDEHCWLLLCEGPSN